MELYKVYVSYKELNKEYVEYIEGILDKKIQDNSDIKITEQLNKFKNAFEELKIKSDEIDIDEKDKENLKDLQYLIVDAIFISYDLINFYTNNHIERFKMRITNYINKIRRVEHNLI